MITYLIGNPGSGKTYYAVYKIYELFLYVPKPSIFDKFKKLPLNRDVCYVVYFYGKH